MTDRELGVLLLIGAALWLALLGAVRRFAMRGPRVDPFLMLFDAPLDGHGLYASRRLADGHWLGVQPLLFGEAQLGLSVEADEDLGVALTRGCGWASIWIYDSRAAAIVAMEMWTGEPTGFLRRVC